MKVNHFWLKNNNEKWSRKNIFEIRELSQITFALRGGKVVRKPCSLLHKKVQTRDVHGQKSQKIQT